MPHAKPEIALRGVRKRFERLKSEVLKGIDLELAPGSFTALLGASGSGKSTLLHLIGGLDTPDAGEIEILGTAVSRLSDDARSDFRLRNLGIVFQFFQLLPALTAQQNAELPARLLRRQGGERTAALFERFGLQERVGAYPHELSGGELQRVALIRSLCNSPRILLADEPTGNLDSVAGQEVVSLLRSICDQDRVTVFMVTHDRSLAASADRIIELSDGELSRR